MKYLIIVLLILLLLIVCIIIVNNKLIRKENNISNAFSCMDVFLKKRYDLIPNLVNTVKGYMKHEKDVLENITKLRTNIRNLHDENLITKSEELDKELDKLFVLTENYPEVKANENFILLQKEMSNIEEEIASARRTYNAHVNNYNIYIKKFPICIITSSLGYKKKSLFEISDEERKNKNWMDK